MKPEEVVTIVGAEPRLAAKLLHIANSTAFNPSGKPLADLRSAITRLWYQKVQSATMAFAIQQMKNAEFLRSIAQPLSELWNQSIAVASIAQVVARRTKVRPDEAFLTGLLHGIGRLYIMVRATGEGSFAEDATFMDLVSGWHAAIGKAVIENWGFAESMAEAIGAQGDYDARHKHAATLSDILIVSVALSDLLQQPSPRVMELNDIFSFQAVGLTEADCVAVLTHAEYALGALHDALGC
jgi:HD-like signal output (HDOD) protein